MPQPSPGRSGSILATSLGLTTVFLTLMIGSMAYVSSSVNVSEADKMRSAAEDAARTGLEMVLGWAEQSIDRINKLPQEWEELNDGQAFDPVQALKRGSRPVGDPNDLTRAEPGAILGRRTHELVVGVQKDPGGLERVRYVTSFKARVQQYRISENMPRQYLIGVAGRVRQVRRGAVVNVDDSERDTIKVERVILATVGKEATSRYAALTDIDLIRNWVPGELIRGPIHINRGYVDQPPFMVRGGPFREIANDQVLVGGQQLRLRDVRSGMDIAIAGQAGNPGFQEVNGVKLPRFAQRVTMTEIRGNAEYPNNDPPAVPAPAPFSMVNANGQVWFNSGVITRNVSEQIFSTENSNPPGNRYGAQIRGPLPIDRPIQLPRSVRDSVGAALGRPSRVLQIDALRERWRNLPDGLYVPTARFWSEDAAEYGRAYDGTADPRASSNPSGGIYVRGNVEHLRITTNGNQTGYLFQVASSRDTGNNPAPSPAQFARRCYMVVADRIEGRIDLYAWPRNGMSLYGRDGQPGLIPAGGITLPQLIALGEALGTTNDPTAWSVQGVAGIKARLAGRGARAPAFNGIIFVDPCQSDPAFLGPTVAAGTPILSPPNHIAVTGHILNLGNPFERDNAYRLDGHRGEVISTEFARADDAAAGSPRPASKLTIMARGSIFIQNHLLVDSVYRAAVPAQTANFNPRTGLANPDTLANLRVNQSLDLLGLVADQQVVVGLRAPSTTTRQEVGVAILGSISALGDPAWRPWATDPTQVLDISYFNRPRRFVGSFTTEGLMQLQGNYENYWILENAVGLPFPTVADWNENNANTPGGRPAPAQIFWRTGGSTGRGFPGHYMYEREGVLPAANPNVDARGRLLVYGSITQKKRGIIGSGNTSYDKDFIFDQRLLSLAPPIFPASVNMILKTQMPFTPDNTINRRMPYRGARGQVVTNEALSFMGTPSE